MSTPSGGVPVSVLGASAQANVREYGQCGAAPARLYQRPDDRPWFPGDGSHAFERDGRVASRCDRTPTGACRHRSEEHTSELQSLMCISYAVSCLKKQTTTNTTDQAQPPNQQ